MEDLDDLYDIHVWDSEEEEEAEFLKDYILDIKEDILDRKLVKQLASEEQDPFATSDKQIVEPTCDSP